MYRRYGGSPNGRYSVRTIEAILNNALLSLYSVVCHVFPLIAYFLTLSTLWKEMEIAEKERSLPVF